MAASASGPSGESGLAVMWTAMPLELVLDGMAPDVQSCVEVTVEGRLLQVLPGANGQGTVQRLISTDPQDYLDPRWQPGSQVSLV